MTSMTLSVESISGHVFKDEYFVHAKADVKLGKKCQISDFRGISAIDIGVSRDGPRCRQARTPGGTFQQHSVEYHQPFCDSGQGSW